jgi:hypothetical protein
MSQMFCKFSTPWNFLARVGVEALVFSPSATDLKSARRMQVTAMTTACDVAAYILMKSRPMTAWTLQKLVYYSQAWSLVWDERPSARAP